MFIFGHDMEIKLKSESNSQDQSCFRNKEQLKRKNMENNRKRYRGSCTDCALIERTNAQKTCITDKSGKTQGKSHLPIVFASRIPIRFWLGQLHPWLRPLHHFVLIWLSPCRCRLRNGAIKSISDFSTSFSFLDESVCLAALLRQNEEKRQLLQKAMSHAVNIQLLPVRR